MLYQLSHQVKPEKAGVVSLSFLQGIFLTQKSNQSLLHCSQILYQLRDVRGCQSSSNSTEVYFNYLHSKESADELSLTNQGISLDI